LVIDLRHNSGGNLGEFIFDRLSRVELGKTKTRGNRETSFPPLANSGKLAVLVNGNTGSDGEVLAQMLQSTGKAKVLGTNSWGGVTGFKGKVKIPGGGYITQPRTVFQIEGAPAMENRGITPDFKVEFPPQSHARGEDPQLAAAVRHLLELI
jgi:tricorn protease